MSNLLKQLADLRDKFTQSADNQDSFLSALLGEGDISSAIITDGLGSTVSIVQQGSDDVYNLLISPDSSSEMQTAFSGSAGQVKTFLKEIAEGEGGLIQSQDYKINLNTFITDATHGMNLNLALAAILDKYTTSDYITSQDLTSLLDNMNLSAGQISQLKTILNLSADQDGKVGAYTFLQALKQVCTASEKALDDGQLSLDNSSIPYLDNFLATAIPGLISVISGVIGAILTAVNAVLGIVVSVIGSVVSTIFGAIVNNVPSEVEVTNYLSLTSWFNGPVTCRYDRFADSIYSGDDSVIKTDEVMVVNDGIFDGCFFIDNKTGDLACNRFVSLSLDRDKVWAWIADNLTVESWQEADMRCYYKLTRITPLTTPSYIPANLYLDDAARENVLSYTGREISNYICSCFGAYCLAEVMFAMKKSGLNSFTFEITGSPTQGADVMSTIAGSIAEQATVDNFENFYIAYRVCQGFRIWTAVKDNGWWADFGNDFLTKISLWESHICNLPISSYTDQVRNDTSTHSIRSAGALVGWQLMSSLSYVPCMIYSGFVFGVNGKVTYSSTGQYSYNHSRLSTIPSSRMFSFAGYSETKLIVFAVVSSAIVATTLIAGSIVAKKIKAFKWKKQMKYKRELMNVQKTWADDPTDENLTNLYKAQKKYNFKAKLFGWDTYDAANNWWNPAGTSSPIEDKTDTNTLMTDVDALMKTITG